MPNINEILLKLEGFQYDTSIDLNMRYYHIQITEYAIKICMIIIPWGKYRYKRLKCNLPENFQQKMNKSSQGF